MMKTIHGFTLLELLIVLTIISISLGLASNSFALIQKVRMDSVAKNIIQAVQFSRTQAIKEGASIFLCLSPDGLSCSSTSMEKLIAYRNSGGDKKLDADDEILRVFDFSGDSAVVKWRAFQNKSYVEFTPVGMTYYQNGTFTVCSNSGDLTLAKAIILNVAGRPYFGKDKNQNGINEYSNGEDINCG